MRRLAQFLPVSAVESAIESAVVESVSIAMVSVTIAVREQRGGVAIMTTMAMAITVMAQIGRNNAGVRAGEERHQDQLQLEKVRN